MKQFHYKAYDESGSMTEGQVVAEDRRAAAMMVREQALSLVSLAEVKKKHRFLTKTPFQSRKSLGLLASEWASLLDAGILLTESLSLLARHREKKERDILLAVAGRIREGHGAGESFAEVGVFPPFFISMIEVGERTGTLSAELAAAARYYRKEAQYLRKIQSTLAYPLFVLLFAFAVLLVILLFILPSFQTLFETLGVPLPAGAAMGIAVGEFLREYGSGLALFFLGTLLLLLLGGRTEAGKEIAGAILYRFSFYRRMLLIRFALTLAAFLESGKPLSDALKEMGTVLGNPAARDALARLGHSLNKGEKFSEALERSGFSTPLLVELSRVGMESGELPKFLKKSAELMGEETEEKLRRFRAILEPAMLLLVGGMTAFVIFSVMLPIFEVAGRSLG